MSRLAMGATVNLSVIAGLAVSGCHPLWAAVLLVWLNMVLYSLRDFYQRVYLFSFLIAFFIFLLGRVTLSEVFDYMPVPYADGVFTHLCTVLIVALLATFVGHKFLSWIRTSRAEKIDGRAHQSRWQADDPRALGVRQAAGIAFWLSVPFAFYYEIERVLRVVSSGYTGLYADTARGSDGTGIDALIGQAALANVAALVVYLATMPPLKRARPVMVAWFLTIAISLASGQRSTFIAGCLFLFCYSVLRNRVTPVERWVTRRGLVGLALVVPVGVLGLAAVETLRGVGNEYAGNPFEVSMAFIYNQGVSSTVITNAFTLTDRIPDQNYMLEFTHSGLLARLLDIPVLQGNSIEKALTGGSFTHSIAYVVLGEASYLAGRGTGSSYVAEAFFSYGYLGVALVALGYGLLLAFAESARPGRLLLNSVGLIIVQDLFWAPRASATGFLSTLLAPATLLTFALIFVLGMALATRFRDATSRAKSSASGRVGQKPL